MSSEIAIVTDTSSDFPADLAKKYNITIVHAYVHFGTDTYRNEDMTVMEFLEKTEKVDKKQFPKTSQASSHDFMEVYEKIKNRGVQTILSIHVSNKLSGTINSANIAAGMLDGIDIHVIDVHGVSFTVSACILRTLDLISQGKNAVDIITELEDFSKNITGYFTLKTLDNLIRGGRMGKFKYRFGKLLNIKPILKIGQDEIKPVAKAKGIVKSREKIYELATRDLDPKKKIYYIIGQADEREGAKVLKDKLLTQFPTAKGFIGEIGMVICAHTGRGALFLLTYQY